MYIDFSFTPDVNTYTFCPALLFSHLPVPGKLLHISTQLMRSGLNHFQQTILKFYWVFILG